MDFIKGFTFAPFAQKGVLSRNETKQSFDTMIENTHANFVIFAPGALQESAHTEHIDYQSSKTMSDDELVAMIEYAKSKEIAVALKPTVNCKNGTWRAHINFFDKDVPCEPKWSNWFKSYTDFQLHYADIAEKTHCDMFIAGCEMVQTERREQEWRKLISDIRHVYNGPISYNTDKYQEDNVKWWDAVDVISSSGYYPINDWKNQLDRIEKVVKEFNKPF
ncbi:MAG: glycoside hydrolase family 113, partial [Oscillospiraceae bacterium]